MLVKVNRNNYLPAFQGQPYNTALSENKGTGNSVLTVVARDQDVQVRISLYNVVRLGRCHTSGMSKAMVECFSEFIIKSHFLTPGSCLCEHVIYKLKDGRERFNQGQP